MTIIPSTKKVKRLVHKENQINKNKTKEKLDQLNKEILELKNGSDGIEELKYKLSQHLIKYDHLKHLYEDEHSQRIELEEIIEESRVENEGLKYELIELTDQNERLTSELIKVENQLNSKVIEIAEFARINQDLNGEVAIIQEKNKEISGLWSQISGLENMVLALRREKSLAEEKNLTQSTIINCITEENKECKMILDKRRKEIEGLNSEIAIITQKTETNTQNHLKSTEIFHQKFENLENDHKNVVLKYENSIESLKVDLNNNKSDLITLQSTNQRLQEE